MILEKRRAIHSALASSASNVRRVSPVDDELVVREAAAHAPFGGLHGGEDLNGRHPGGDLVAPDLDA
jgi:hypothetical protein